VFVPFEDGKPKGTVEDVLTGFLNDKARPRAGRWASRSTGRRAAGRDDVGNVVWR
jgi:glucose/arabinose dehydrogenase